MRDYLLSPTHPVGKYKAVFFGSLGYSQDDSDALVADLKQHAMEGDARESEASAFGQKYEVRGRMGRVGREAAVVSVWIVLLGEDFPRLITAFPGPKS